jgi:chorismate synthase
MDAKTEGLVKLIDEAIEIGERRLEGKRRGQSDPSSEEDLAAILSGLAYRRSQSINEGFAVGNEDVSLGLARAALEYDRPDSTLVKKIGEIEKYFQRHFVRSR